MAKKLGSGFKKSIPAQELLSELYMQIKEYEEQIRTLSSNLQLLQLQHEEIQKTLATVKELGEAEPGHDVLIPLGAGVYSSFKTSENSKLTVNVGSRVYMEKMPEVTLEVLEGRLKNSEGIISKVQEQLNQMAQRHQNLSQQFQLVAQRVQESQGQVSGGTSPPAK